MPTDAHLRLEKAIASAATHLRIAASDAAFYGDEGLYEDLMGMFHHLCNVQEALLKYRGHQTSTRVGSYVSHSAGRRATT